MPRFWLSGPRLFNGLLRPGISFALSELSKKPSRTKRGGDLAPEPELGKGHSPAHFAAFFRALFWFLLSLTAWGLMLYGFLTLVGCVGGAFAGTCRYYTDGGYSVTACDDGYFSTTDSHGRRRQYGERNGGFQRYPGHGGRPVFERRD